MPRNGSFCSNVLTYSGFVLVFMASIASDVLAQDSTFVKKGLDTVAVGESRSGYANIKASGGPNSVASNLKADDVKKDAWVKNKFQRKVFDSYYDFKRFLKVKHNIALGTDYMLLNQFASFSFSDNQASSGIFRFYATWTAPLKDTARDGSFVVKIENRHAIGPGVTPRNLGYYAGAALSTASFKDFSWGLTNFYWKQLFASGRFGFAAGIMDPGDWVDLYPLLNPFKYYLNEAFFNSPAMAIPNQGLGFAFVAKKLIANFYVAGGLHDANGEPTNFLYHNFKSFFVDHEYMVWVEAGWNADDFITDGRTIHLMYWHQDPRTANKEVNEQVEESWGISFSASDIFFDKYTGFLRGGYAEGNGARMRYMILGGISSKVIKHDQAGISFSWGAPNDKTRRDQLGLELFYSLQLTDNLNLTPDMQFTVNPSFNDEKDFVAIYSVIRIRYAL